MILESFEYSISELNQILTKHSKNDIKKKYTRSTVIIIDGFIINVKDFRCGCNFDICDDICNMKTNIFECKFFDNNKLENLNRSKIHTNINTKCRLGSILKYNEYNGKYYLDILYIETIDNKT